MLHHWSSTGVKQETHFAGLVSEYLKVIIGLRFALCIIINSIFKLFSKVYSIRPVVFRLTYKSDARHRETLNVIERE